METRLKELNLRIAGLEGEIRESQSRLRLALRAGLPSNLLKNKIKELQNAKDKFDLERIRIMRSL